MTTQDQIKEYMASLTDAKRSDMEALQSMIVKLLPGGEMWFLDGKDDKGKVVSNPNIGYGRYTITYADGKTKDFYQTGISANTTGISVYIMGIQDKNYLPETYGKKIGKATVNGYCIKFRALKDINREVLEEAIRDGIGQTS